MREVSQNWLNNQNKTLREQGLLRIDLISSHRNNAKSTVTPLLENTELSHMENIKDIYLYDKKDPSKKGYVSNLMSINNGQILQNVADGYYFLYLGTRELLDGGTF